MRPVRIQAAGVSMALAHHRHRVLTTLINVVALSVGAGQLFEAPETLTPVRSQPIAADRILAARLVLLAFVEVNADTIDVAGESGHTLALVAADCVDAFVVGVAACVTGRGAFVDVSALVLVEGKAL